jgi:hypothetical protein
MSKSESHALPLKENQATQARQCSAFRFLTQSQFIGHRGRRAKSKRQDGCKIGVAFQV